MNPLEKIVKGGSTLQGKQLEGGNANAKKPTTGGAGTHAKKPTVGGSSCSKKIVGGSKSIIGGKKKSRRSSKKKGGNGFLSHITLPDLFVAANTMFGKKKSSKNKKRSPLTKKNRK